MFDLITGKAVHIPGGGRGPVLVSTALHVAGLAAVVTVPLLLFTNAIPEVPTMMAFVASLPDAPPPPPPPPPPARSTPPARETAHAAPVAEQLVAPADAPREIVPESAPSAHEDEGLPGGVEGGMPGGVVGGIVGGLPGEAPPPPPPPPPSVVSKRPVRIGGQIQPPTLVRRVEPIYPEFAVRAHLEGVVILEALVSEDGQVQEVKVLRSAGVLDRAALEAVRQWRYSPVILNGTPMPFTLTVVVSFSVPDDKAAKRVHS